MPAFAPVLSPYDSSWLGPHGRPSAKTWLMMTDTVAAAVVAVMVSATAELIDARTFGGTDTDVDSIL